MKKNLKRVMASVMAAALAFSLAGTAAEADAAKKAKFASKSVTVNVGKTKTVKIKNVKANKVKKLTVKSKSKKIATVSKKGKTAVKVKGKKKGTTKVTATLKIKGQKKAAKLTLTVKVKKPAPSTVTPAPVVPTAAVTAAPPAPSAPAVTNAPSTGAPATGVPATTTPAGPTKVPTEKPTAKPKWTPDPDKVQKVQDVSIKYDYEFPGTRVVKFDGTVVNHEEEENAKAEGYPKDGFDVRYYKKVIVKYEGKKLTGDGDWFGKATLSSTDEGLGQNEYADGLFLKYLNDVDTAGGYKDGVYTVEYDIDESKLVDGFDFEDVGSVDCFSVQLAAEDDYAGFKLLSADFIAMDKPVVTPDPNATADPNTPTVTVKLGKAKVAQGETTSVELVVPAGAEIVSQTWSVEKADIAEVKDNVVTAKAVGDTKISVKAVVKSAGKDYNVEASATLSVKDKNELIVNATLENAPTELAVNETAMVTVAVDTGSIESVTWKAEGGITINGDNDKAMLTGTKPGDATVTATVTVKSGEKTTVEEVTAAVKVTPQAIVINKELELDKAADGNAWSEIILDQPIKVKKTDSVEVVFSVKSGSADSMSANGDAKVKVALSTMADDTAYKKNESAVLRTEASAAGKAAFVRQDAFFTSNYAEIKAIVAQNTTALEAEKVAVVIEKITITPTDEIALSLHAPATVEVGKTVKIDAEVDEGYTLDWKSSDATKATVNSNGEVTGVAEADEVTITVEVKKDGTKVKEATVTMAVADSYKGKPIELDLAEAVLANNSKGEIKQTKDGSKVTAIEILNDGEGITFDLPHKVAKGETIKVAVEGSIADSGTGFRLYLVPAKASITGTSNIYGPYQDKGAMNISGVELTASNPITALCFRVPAPGGKVDGVTITKVTVEYVS